ncbi:MAG: glycosyltransferase, partial [Clostridia bacterium]|nr:glycosyltransferase [Clostridia bacterium]
YTNGADVVYGVRSSRKKDSFFKKFTAESYYKIMKRLGVELVFNHADYRLMSKRAVEGLQQFKEVNLFLRGVVPMVGYPSEKVYYERAERFAGESKYPLKKMVSFALDGVTSFSAKPLGMIFTCGVILSLLGFAGVIVTIILLALNIVPAWSLLLAAMVLCTGIIVSCIGVVGIYVGKSYTEAKGRPRFIIEEILNDADISSNEQ